MTSRRGLLAGAATGALALTAGCLDVLTGGPIEFDASAVRPGEDALAETGYEEQLAEWQEIEETVSVGVERDVHASVWVATYSKTVALQGSDREAALFGAVSMPAMDVLGSPRNPIAGMDGKELLEEVQGRMGGGQDGVGQLRDLSHEEAIELSILGAQREVDRLSGRTDVEGQEMEVGIDVASFDNEGDLLVLLGAYPQLLPDEAVNAEVLMESVEHPIEA